MTTQPRFPPYFDLLIEGYRHGAVGRCVHLGHWDDPEAAWRKPADRAGEFERAQARLDEILIGMADLEDGLAVLDVGCGFGGTLQAIDRSWQEMSLTGVNLDPRQLRICRDLRSRPSNRMQWREADACALPFSNDQFDRIFCIEAMFHFASRRRFFAEAARVLRPGGILIASDMVLTRDAAAGGALDRNLATRIVAGYGPWPDLAGADCDHRSLAKAAGLTTELIQDVSANTAPSHRFTAPGDDPHPEDAMALAASALRDLHVAGLMTYLYLRFEKPSHQNAGNA